VKISALFFPGAVGLLISGCSSPAPLVLAPVGPPINAPAAQASTGALKVFTAYDQSPYVDPLARLRYTSYRIFSSDGTLMKTVVNNAAPAGPAVVALNPGKYKVLARANGYGVLEVPVVIAANETTVVHLDGGSRWSQDGIPATPVRLPHGEIAGWSLSAAHAETNALPPTARAEAK
jgi:hypothetical protein